MTRYALGGVVASAVRAERSRRRWTQTQLAQKLGWGRSTVSDLESGKRAMLVDDLPSLCEVLDVPLWELMRQADGRTLARLRVWGAPGDPRSVLPDADVGHQRRSGRG